MSLSHTNESGNGANGGGHAHTLQAPRLLPGGYPAWKPLMHVYLQRQGADGVHTEVSTVEEWSEWIAMLAISKVQAQADTMACLRAELAASSGATAAASSSSPPVVPQVTKVSDELKAARKHLAGLVERSVRAHAALYYAIPEELRVQADDSVSQGWAYGLWNWLANKFQSTEEDNVDALITEWTQLRQDEDESFAAYRARVNKLATLLELAKDKPSAPQYANTMLSKLQPLYKQAVLALRAGDKLKDKAKIDWEYVTKFINSHEREEHRLDDAAAGGAAMALRHSTSYAKAASHLHVQSRPSQVQASRSFQAKPAVSAPVSGTQCIFCKQIGRASCRERV